MAQANNNLDILSNIKLSIQIHLNGLSFCVLEEESHTITYLNHLVFEKKQTPFKILDRLKEAFSNIDILKNKFSAVTIIYVNELSTLIPKPLFNEDNLADYLKFNSKILKSDFISYDEISINDSINVYIPYVNINNFIYDKFGAFTYKHFSSILIDTILNLEKNASKPKMYIHITKNHFEIIVIKNSKLEFYNTFDYVTKEDFIYYTLFTIEQLNLNPETIDVKLIGDIIKGDDLYNIAYKYIRFVSFGLRQDAFNVSELSISKHSDFILLNSF